MTPRGDSQSANISAHKVRLHVIIRFRVQGNCISPFQFLEPGRGDDQVLQEWDMGREQCQPQPRGGPVPQDSCM